MSIAIKYDEKTGFIQVQEICFAPGFRSVNVHGKHIFDFTKTQAQIIEIVFDYVERGFTSVFQAEIIRHMNDRRFDQEDKELLRDIRLRDYFKIDKGHMHAAWGTLIKTTKGRDSKIYIDFSFLL